MFNIAHKLFDDDKTYDLKELVSKIKLKPGTVYTKVEKGKIPFHKTAPGKGKLVFIGIELNEWARSNVESTKPPYQFKKIESLSLKKAKKSTSDNFKEFLKNSSKKENK